MNIPAKKSRKPLRANATGPTGSTKCSVLHILTQSRLPIARGIYKQESDKAGEDPWNNSSSGVAIDTRLQTIGREPMQIDHQRIAMEIHDGAIFKGLLLLPAHIGIIENRAWNTNCVGFELVVFVLNWKFLRGWKISAKFIQVEKSPRSKLG